MVSPHSVNTQMRFIPLWLSLIVPVQSRHFVGTDDPANRPKTSDKAMLRREVSHGKTPQGGSSASLLNWYEQGVHNDDDEADEFNTDEIEPDGDDGHTDPYANSDDLSGTDSHHPAKLDPDSEAAADLAAQTARNVSGQQVVIGEHLGSGRLEVSQQEMEDGESPNLDPDPDADCDGESYENKENNYCEYICFPQGDALSGMAGFDQTRSDQTCSERGYSNHKFTTPHGYYAKGGGGFTSAGDFGALDDDQCNPHFVRQGDMCKEFCAGENGLNIKWMSDRDAIEEGLCNQNGFPVFVGNRTISTYDNADPPSTDDS